MLVTFYRLRCSVYIYVVFRIKKNRLGFERVSNILATPAFGHHRSVILSIIVESTKGDYITSDTKNQLHLFSR